MAQRTNSSGQRREESSRREEPSRQRREEKEQLSIPPMRYKLTKLTQAQTLTEIAIKTQGFYDLSTYSADWIQRDVRSREFSSFGNLLMPRQLNVVDTVIGEDNYYLKLTTKNHNMDYICYDRDNNELQFWGEYQCCVRAMNELRYRLIKIQTRHEEKIQRKWPVSKCSNDNSEERQRNDDEIQVRDYDYDERSSHGSSTVLDPSYSPVSIKNMAKMGFVSGKGLGATGSGRIEPVNPIKDLGGRSSKSYYGIGFTEPVEKYLPAEPTYEIDTTVPAVPVAKVITDAERYGCKCNGDTGVCCMSCWRNADA